MIVESTVLTTYVRLTEPQDVSFSCSIRNINPPTIYWYIGPTRVFAWERILKAVDNYHRTLNLIRSKNLEKSNLGVLGFNFPKS
jgi:hypothetical protein